MFHELINIFTSALALPLYLIVGVLLGIEYHGRGGSFFSFKNGQYPTLFGYDENGTPYFNYGGTEAARICWWALPVTLQTYLLSLVFYLTAMVALAPWLVAVIFILEFVALFVSLLVLSHGPFQSFGTMVTTKPNWLAKLLPSYTMADSQWKRELIDFTGLTITGFLRAVLQAAPLLLISFNFLWLLAGGAMMGVAYALGYKVLQNRFKIKYFTSATDWGEFLTGVFYGIATGKSVV